MKKPTFKLIIPEWKNEIVIGIVEPTYYKASNKTSDKIKKMYKVKHCFGDHYYVDKNGSRVIKNKKTVGNEKTWRVNGQSFYTVNLHWKIRNEIVTQYHRYITDYIKEAFTEPFPIYLNSTLSMHINIYEIYTSKTPDITNMWILPKMIEDCFVIKGILKEDSPEFRTKTSYEYVFVEEEKDRKLEIIFKYISR